jgi:hypothetical protein
MTFDLSHHISLYNTSSGSLANPILICLLHYHSGIPMGTSTSFYRTQKYDNFNSFSGSVFDIGNHLTRSTPDLEAL